MRALEKNIREGEISEEDRKLLWEFKRDFEVQNYSQGRIYKLLIYLKIIAEHVNYDFEEASEGVT